MKKNLDTTYTQYSKQCRKCKQFKLTPSTIIHLWDERIKRIKLASLAYFVAEDETTFYGLHWDLQQYRRSREIGQTNYPLKPDSKPLNPRDIAPKYLLDATPPYLLRPD